MLKSRKTLRFAIPCLVLVGLALALSVQRWSAHAQSEQDPVTQSAQYPIRIRPLPPAVENLGAQAATVPNGPTATITVNSLADGSPSANGQCTLREALINANVNSQAGSTDCAAGSGADTITLSVNGTINLTDVLPAISENLTITGPGANLLTVRRNTGGDYRIFQINSGVSVDLTGLTISNGNASSGGGIRNYGILTITNCAITGNLGSDGGGIFNGGSLNVYNSTISGNTAAGAGLYNEGDAYLFNSTISGNTGTGNGTVIYNRNLGDLTNTMTLVVVNCTVTANNRGVDVGAIETIAVGGIAETYLRNTIVANNSGPNLLKLGTTASVISQGNNLASDNGSGLLTQPSDKINTDPLLSPLGNYGGPTQTHALLPGSPAIDADEHRHSRQ